ncbi:MAG: VOC family protein [Anaerolineales bacterium]|nr:VOC family protein [Anaerolineales bacterium]MCB0026600.1 VOC family protein [Anaerolineales bacterium]
MIQSLLGFECTNTILYCRHWAETAHFYETKLCLPVSFENDWFIEFRLTDGTFLSIANAVRTSIDDVQGQGVTLAWKVPNLGRAKQLLEDRGITTTVIQQKWNAQVFYLFDPEGHRIELWTDGCRIEGQIG